MIQTAIVAGIRQIERDLPLLTIGQDITVAGRQVQSLADAQRTLVALGVAERDDQLAALFGSVREALDERRVAAQAEISAMLVQRFGRNTRLEPVEGADAAAMLLDIAVGDPDGAGDVVVTLGDRNVESASDRLSLEGETLEVRDIRGDLVTGLALIDMVAIAVTFGGGLEVLMRDGRHLVVRPVE